MSAPLPHSTKNMRTFADDLKAVREKRGDVDPSQADSENATKTAEPTPIYSAPKPIKAVPHTRETTVTKEAVVKNQEEKKNSQVPTPKKDTGRLPVPTPPKKKRSAVPTPTAKEDTVAIPTFHKLQKEVDSIDVLKEPESTATNSTESKEKPTSKRTEPEINIGYDSAIIRDTKHNRFRFFPEVFSSLKDWFKKLTKPKKKQIPKYAVTETSRRKGVIQTATTKTGSIFTADNSTLREQIRRRNRAQKEADADKETDEPETTWSPYTEPGFALLTETAPQQDSTQNPQVTFRQRSQPTPASQTAIPENHTPKTTSAPAPDAKPAPKPVPAVSQSKPPTEEPVYTEPPVSNTPPVQSVSQSSPEQPTKAPAPTKSEESSVPTEVETSTPNTNTESVTSPEKNILSRFGINFQETNTLTILVLLIIILIAVGVFTVFNLLHILTTNEPETEVTQAAVTESLIATAQLNRILVQNNDAAEVITTLQAVATEKSPGVHEFVLVNNSGEKLTPDQVLTTVGIQIPAILQQALTEVRFISINNSLPTLVLSFTDKSSARGGFLQWENTLASEVAPLFKLENPNTGSFIDRMIANTDARVRVINSESTIAYALVGEHIAIVTSDIQILNHINNNGYFE